MDVRVGPLRSLSTKELMLYLLFYAIVVVQSLSHVQLFGNPWTAALLASLSFTIAWSLLRLMSSESMMPSNFLIHYHLLLPLPPIFRSLRVFSQWVGSSHQVAKGHKRRKEKKSKGIRKCPTVDESEDSSWLQPLLRESRCYSETELAFHKVYSIG